MKYLAIMLCVLCLAGCGEKPIKRIVVVVQIQNIFTGTIINSEIWQEADVIEIKGDMWKIKWRINGRTDWLDTTDKSISWKELK